MNDNMDNNRGDKVKDNDKDNYNYNDDNDDPRNPAVYTFQPTRCAKVINNQGLLSKDIIMGS
jgi:hypothetical protein